MQVCGPLMIEHRVIERMIAIIRDTLAQVEKTRECDPLFVDKAIDFIWIYADRTHHEKEKTFYSEN